MAKGSLCVGASVCRSYSNTKSNGHRNANWDVVQGTLTGEGIIGINHQCFHKQKRLSWNKWLLLPHVCKELAVIWMSVQVTKYWFCSIILLDTSPISYSWFLTNAISSLNQPFVYYHKHRARVAQLTEAPNDEHNKSIHIRWNGSTRIC